MASDRRLRATLAHLLGRPARPGGAPAAGASSVGSIQKLIVVNRGEIAIRIFRAADELGLRTVAVYSADDERALHPQRAHEAVALGSSGPAAYLDVENLIAKAKEVGADAVHPGYGFLSENAAFVRRCEEEGLVFVGPTSDTIALFGDKTQARALAIEHTPEGVLPGTDGAVNADEVRSFFEAQGGAPIMLKAVAGGGGRGMRIVRTADEIEDSYRACSSEAEAAFGQGSVFAERLFERPRHIEIQVVGDGTGSVTHLYERDCSVQRQNQKIVEIAPCPSMSAALRQRITSAAVNLASAVKYRGAGTVEFLVDAELGDDASFAFMEVNPRLQVEHTVTEEITDLDLVQTQLRIAGGDTLASLGLTQEQIPPPSGVAIQARVNMEAMQADGTARPAGGVLTAYTEPGGRRVRVDSCGFAGFRPPHSTAFWPR